MTSLDRARALVGAPFRLHGRDAQGVDCVGLIALIHAKAERVPIGYALRTAELVRWTLELDEFFKRREDGHYDAGDILLMAAGPVQLHLGIWTGSGLIHAHAGLRRVVETPGPVPWPVVGVWRAPEID